MVMEGFYFLQAMLLMVICWGCIGWIILRLFWETKWFIRRMHRRWQQPLEDQQPKQHEQVAASVATFQQQEKALPAVSQGVPLMIESPSRPEDPPDASKLPPVTTAATESDYRRFQRELREYAAHSDVTFSGKEMSALYITMRLRFGEQPERKGAE